LVELGMEPKKAIVNVRAARPGAIETTEQQEFILSCAARKVYMIQNFTDIHLKPGVLGRYGLPDIAYPVPAEDLEAALTENVELPLAAMLFGLQQRNQDGKADWKKNEVAMERLAHLLTPDDRQEVVVTAGKNWWLEIGPVDLTATLVTIQRGDSLTAAITAREDGRLRVAVFRPLCAKSAQYLIGLSVVPDPEYGVCMRENNWEYALDCSALSIAHAYAADRGEAYLSFWERGIGISRDGAEVREWRKMKNLIARSPSLVATELKVHCMLLAEDGAENDGKR
jgi:hypothetical protein